MRFKKHPYLSLLTEFEDAYIARISKYSFIIALHKDKLWYTSWQDQEKGGSASSTIEGPFETRSKAEANCRYIYKQLRNKN